MLSMSFAKRVLKLIRIFFNLKHLISLRHFASFIPPIVKSVAFCIDYANLCSYKRLYKFTYTLYYIDSVTCILYTESMKSNVLKEQN